MRFEAAVVCFAASLCAISASAEWKSNQVQDPSLGASGLVYDTVGKPVGGAGSPVRLLISGSEGKPRAVFSIEGGKFSGCGERLCDVSVRFDEGSAKEISAANPDATTMIPIEVSTFVGATAASKELYVNFAVDGVATEYRFDISGLPVDIPATPEVSVLGYEFGRKYAESQISLSKYKESGRDACYEDGNGKPFGKQSVKRTSICFYEGFPYLAVIKTGSKAADAEGEKFLSSVFGGKSSGPVGVSWPRAEENILSYTTRRASFLPPGSRGEVSTYIITDEVTALRGN